MLRTGASPEIDTGATQSQSGCQTMARKLSALDLLPNLRDFQESLVSKISTENSLTTLLSHPNKAKESSREFLRFSIAGLSPVPCHSLKATILSPFKMNNS